MKKLTAIIIITFLLCGCSSKKETEIEKINLPQSFDITENEVINDTIISPLSKSGDKSFNINNLFEITIPQNLEIITLNQYLFVDRDNTQYGIRNYFGIVFNEYYFVLSIDCFGNTNSAILNGNETLNLRKIIQPHIYNSRNQANYLIKNYLLNPLTNENNIKMGKYISSWGTSWSSDYHGIYFTLPNNDYNECIIYIFNIWGTFYETGNLADLDINNYEKILEDEGGNLAEIYKELKFLENSIKYDLSDDLIMIEFGNIDQIVIEDVLIMPTIENLRMRKQPSLTGEIIGYMENKIHRIVAIGNDEEIDGIEGKWLMIIPSNKNTVSWIFSGYTRKPTSEELWKYYGG